MFSPILLLSVSLSSVFRTLFVTAASKEIQRLQRRAKKVHAMPVRKLKERAVMEYKSLKGDRRVSLTGRQWQGIHELLTLLVLMLNFGDCICVTVWLCRSFQHSTLCFALFCSTDNDRSRCSR